MRAPSDTRLKIIKTHTVTFITKCENNNYLNSILCIKHHKGTDVLKDYIHSYKTYVRRIKVIVTLDLRIFSLSVIFLDLNADIFYEYGYRNLNFLSQF